MSKFIVSQLYLSEAYLKKKQVPTLMEKHGLIKNVGASNQIT